MVLNYLRQLDRLQTAREIQEALLREHAEYAPGLTTVYRSVDTLHRLDLIQQVDLGDGEKRYEYVNPGEHHHHLVCTLCKANVHLDSCVIDAMKMQIENQHGFTVSSHVLELFGICPECRKLKQH